MEVLKIELEAPVCSFRYPHFLVGQQLTFDMPPPSTIYGHVCSAVGEWLPRDSFKFAYRFTYGAKGEDLEKQQILSVAGGKFDSAGQTYAKSTTFSENPVVREFLFNVKLTLYIDRTDFFEAFNNPIFPVILGRSQDLACYISITKIKLEQSPAAYLDSTILPFSFRNRTPKGITVLMPKFIAPPPFRHPEFDKFIIVRDRISAGTKTEPSQESILKIDGENSDFWVDPSSIDWKGLRRGLVFHSFC